MFKARERPASNQGRSRPSSLFARRAAAVDQRPHRRHEPGRPAPADPRRGPTRAGLGEASTRPQAGHHRTMAGPGTERNSVRRDGEPRLHVCDAMVATRGLQVAAPHDPSSCSSSKRVLMDSRSAGTSIVLENTVLRWRSRVRKRAHHRTRPHRTLVDMFVRRTRTCSSRRITTRASEEHSTRLGSFIPTDRLSAGSHADSVQTGPTRIAGAELMTRLLELGAPIGLRHYLFGSTPDVIDRLRDSLSVRHPRAQIVGALAPPFGQLLEEAGVCDMSRPCAAQRRTSSGAHSAPRNRSCG